jgi:hypothetical protein
MSILSRLFGKKTEKPVVRLERHGSFAAEIVGESHYQSMLDKVTGGRTEEGHRKRVEAMLIYDDKNSYDNKAIAVAIGGDIVGHLNRKNARQYRLHLAEAGFPGSPAVCGALIVGGWKRDSDEGHYGVRLDLPAG